MIKIAKSFVKENINLITNGAGSKEELARELINMVEKELDMTLDLKHIQNILMLIEREYQIHKKLPILPSQSSKDKKIPNQTNKPPQDKQGDKTQGNVVNIIFNIETSDIASVISSNKELFENIVKENFSDEKNIDEIAYKILNELNKITGRSFSDFYLDSIKTHIREVLHTINPWH